MASGNCALLNIDIFENGEIRMMDPTRRGGIQNPFRCEQLSDQALAGAIDALENLVSFLSVTERPIGDQGELLQLHWARDDAWHWGAVDGLSPDGLEFVRAIVCLAHESLEQWPERAMRYIGPELSARLDYPATCAPWMGDSPL